MRQKHMHFVAQGSLTQRKVFDGKEYLVAPVVMIREGVLNSELVLASEFGTAYESWNGTPIVINHPQERGVFISANSPEVLELSGVGQVFNVRFEDEALKAEMWIDVNKATILGGEALQALSMLEAGELLEVSTAYIATTTPKSGVFKGQAYSGVQGVPFNDHLALLPNQTGACSVAMGCGGNRFNQRQEVVRVTTKPKQNLLSRMASMFAPKREAKTSEGVTANEGESYNELWQALDSSLSQVLSDPWDYYIVDVYDDAVIYRHYDEGGMFRRPYTLAGNLDVTLGEPEEVVQRVSYEAKGEPTVSANEATEQPSEPEQPEVLEEPQGPQPETPDEPEAESDGEPEAEPETPDPPQPETPTANAKPCGCDDAANERSNVKDKAPAPKANAKPKTEEEFLDEMPEGDAKNFMTNGIKAHAKHRTQLIDGLKANERCTFDEGTLSAMQTEQLEQLSEMLAPADYSGVLPPRTNASTEEDDKPLVLNSVAARLPAKQEAVQA